MHVSALEESVTEYGIRTDDGPAILMVTEDRREAERTLEMMGRGRLITRTVRYGPWQPADAGPPGPGRPTA